MKLSPRQSAILRGALRDRDHYSALARPDTSRSGGGATQWLHTQDCKRGFVATNPSVWLGVAMTAADYVSTSRNYKQLERKGLIIRHALGYDGSATTHLELTPEGEAVARELLAAALADTEGSGDA